MTCHPKSRRHYHICSVFDIALGSLAEIAAGKGYVGKCFAVEEAVAAGYTAALGLALE